MEIVEVVGTKEGDEFDLKEVYVAHCPKCGAKLRKGRYGTDEECPECGIWIEWVINR